MRKAGRIAVNSPVWDVEMGSIATQVTREERLVRQDETNVSGRCNTPRVWKP